MNDERILSRASRMLRPLNVTEYSSSDSFSAPLIHMSAFLAIFSITDFIETFSIVAERPSFLKSREMVPAFAWGTGTDVKNMMDMSNRHNRMAWAAFRRPQVNARKW
ncbi:MAG: hypothetical protein JRJ09_16945 [Deltaproteobacteria bacterium]|nr:hypothetical protein [Deltaproteobacteria bacterium]